MEGKKLGCKERGWKRGCKEYRRREGEVRKRKMETFGEYITEEEVERDERGKGMRREGVLRE